MNYYNDNDSDVCAWLRELMARGLLPPGDVDQRSICDVKPKEIEKYDQCHFFAGIGGWPLALCWAGLADATDIWTGSCPCQPFSSAGQQRGYADERHLWSDFRRLIAERRPATIFGEQVASALGRQWLAGVRFDLENMGYACGAADLCAAGVGAPHQRQRLYWVAHRVSAGLEGHPRHVNSGDQPRWLDALAAGPVAAGGGAGPLADSADADGRGDFSVVHFTDGKARRIESQPQPLADGVPALLEHLRAAGLSEEEIESAFSTFPLITHPVGRRMLLRGYGNAIVPHLAAEFIRAAMEA